MKNLKLILIILFLNSFCVLAKECEIPSIEKQRLLDLSYQEFDQTMGKGWRKIGEQDHCYLEAAKLLDNYLKHHQNTLLDWQSRVIIWHSGQMYGFSGDTKLAKMRFLSSVNPNELRDTQILWNDYVYASVAFLDKNIKKLKYHREIIAKGPNMDNGKIANLDVVDRLLKCFDKPYSIAYSGCN